MNDLVVTWLDVCAKQYGFDNKESIEYLNERLGGSTKYEYRILYKWKDAKYSRLPSLEAYYVMMSDVLRDRLAGIPGINSEALLNELVTPELQKRLDQGKGG
jgi:hypothetical protein